MGIDAPSRVHGLERADVVAFLVDRYGPATHNIAYLDSGYWSDCFSFEVGDESFVTRFGHHRDDYERDHFASQHYGTQLAVPHVVEIGDAFGMHFATSRRAYGVALDALDASQWDSVVPDLLAALDALRTIPVDPALRFGSWDRHGRGNSQSWDEYLLRVAIEDPKHRAYGWRQALDNYPTGAQAFSEAMRCLEAIVGQCGQPHHLVHNDLMNRNVLVDGARISAILDWGCSFYGDFLYEVAGIDFWTPWFPAMQHLDLTARLRSHCDDIGVRVDNFDARLRACRLHIGLEHIAYNAFTADFDSLDKTAERMLEFA